jgi:hypothetical protein
MGNLLMRNEDGKFILLNEKYSKFILLNEKKAFEWDMVAWYAVGFAILVIGVLGYLILTGKFTGGIDFVKNLFRFGP